VVSVPIAAVAARVKGTDTNIEDKKKQQKKGTDDNADEDNHTVASDELEEVVFVIGKDNKIEKRVVTTGIQDINNIEVTSGLKEGEQVVTGPYNAVSKTLRSGDKVQVVSQEKLFEK
jgi:HlyD family secretion protein